ncbi:MAG: hypothetical protein JJT94_17755, partial [Bernardetiaceae bacterium]|nr:hypothetical protein [Bernardetiaceae bacterium]
MYVTSTTLRKVCLLLLLFLVCFYEQSQAQTDSQFWFAAPEVTAGHGDEPILMRYSAGDNPATVTLSMPSNPAFVPIVTNVPANTSVTVNLTPFKADFESFPYNAIINTGVLVESTADITAYYEVNRNNNPDIFALKGNNALGTDFHIPMQTDWDHQQNLNPRGHSGFIIVATQNNTQVTITPSRNIIGRPAGVPFTVILNRGEVYCAATSQPQSGDAAPNGFPAGSIVTSDKPVAITLYHDSIRSGQGGCHDLAGDQLVPDNIVGIEYIIMRGQLGNNNNANVEKVYVLATQDNTEVFVDGNPMAVGTINKGEQQVINIPWGKLRTYITTTNPCYVIHLSGFGCETGLAILPPIECTGSKDVFFVRSTNETFFVNIMVPNGYQQYFRYNGGPENGVIAATAFNPVPGTGGDWVSAQIPFTGAPNPTLAAGGVGRIQNDSILFQMGLVNGGASSGCRYGYFSNFNAVNLGPDINVDYGVTITLDAGTDAVSYLWSTGEATRTIEVGLWAWGDYWVSADIGGGCVLSDSICVGTNQYVWRGDISLPTPNPNDRFSVETNWSKRCDLDGIPVCGQDVVLPDPTGAFQINYPLIVEGGSYAVRDLIMEANTHILIRSGSTLDICGDFYHNGILEMEPGATLRFTGSEGKQRYIRTANAVGEFENVVINNTSLPLSDENWAHVAVDATEGVGNFVISETGTLVFETGALLTEGNLEVFLKNRAPNALRFGTNLPHTLSPNCGIETFVIGKLRRNINSLGRYDFPVGLALLTPPNITDDATKVGNFDQLPNTAWTPLTDAQGYCGEATTVLTFGGAGHRINLPTTVGIGGAGSRTVEVWVNLGNNTERQGVFQLGRDMNLRDFALTKQNGNNDRWEMRFGGTTTLVNIPGSRTGWHHFAMTYNGTEAKLYYDGTLVNTTIISLATELTNRRIGRWQGNSFVGQLDNFRVWNYERTEAQIQEGMCRVYSCPVEPGLQAQYDFEEGAGTEVNHQIYDCFPPELRYELAQINFTLPTDTDNILAEFFPYPGATPGPTGQTNICGVDFDVCDALNHGFWQIDA